MPEHIVGLQVSAPQQNQQQQQMHPQAAELQRRWGATTPLSIGQFIVDDLKLFVSPVTAVVNEFRRQVKR